MSNERNVVNSVRVTKKQKCPRLRSFCFPVSAMSPALLTAFSTASSGGTLPITMERVEKKLGSIAGDEDYRSVLIGWLTEAAIGLEAESARVNASPPELKLIDDRVLSEVSRRVRRQTSRQIELMLSDAEPLKSQGVVLTAADGRTAFNNQVRTRMLRSKREIQMLIYNTLFTDEQKQCSAPD